MELYNFNIINCNLDLKQSASFIINLYRWADYRKNCALVLYDFNNDFSTIFHNYSTNTSSQLIESYKKTKIIPDPLPLEIEMLADNSSLLFLSVELSDDLYGVESRDFVFQVCKKSFSRNFQKPIRLVNINHTEYKIITSWELELLTDPFYKNIFLLDSDKNTYGITKFLDNLGLKKEIQNNKFLDFIDLSWYEKLETNCLTNQSLFPKFNFRNPSDNCNYSLLDFNKGGKLIETVENIFTWLWLF